MYKKSLIKRPEGLSTYEWRKYYQSIYQKRKYLEYPERAKLERSAKPEIYKLRDKRSNNKRKKYRSEWMKIKQRKLRSESLSYRIRDCLSSRLRNCIKTTDSKKYFRTLDYLGCSVEFLKGYLSGLFQEGMTFENYGRNGWHIDHIIPCASFDFTNPEAQRECFHYTNLQPMWEADNIRKRDLMPDGSLARHIKR